MYPICTPCNTLVLYAHAPESIISHARTQYRNLPYVSNTYHDNGMSRFEKQSRVLQKCRDALANRKRRYGDLRAKYHVLARSLQVLEGQLDNIVCPRETYYVVVLLAVVLDELWYCCSQSALHVLL